MSIYVLHLDVCLVVFVWEEVMDDPMDDSRNVFQIEAKVIWQLPGHGSGGGRRGALCGIEEIRTVSGTSL